VEVAVVAPVGGREADPAVAEAGREPVGAAELIAAVACGMRASRPVEEGDSEAVEV
jgi:hypothetical protein